jgi:sigma-E factor negative regulatory protein RseB
LVLRNATAPLLVLTVWCWAAASAWAQQEPLPGAAFGASAGEGDSTRGQPPATGLSGTTAEPARGTAQWLMRLRQGARGPAYTGTYVVWSAGGLTSSRIWRVSQGDVQVEWVDALSGPPRSTCRITDRRGSRVETFLPARRVLRIDRSDGLDGGGFPNLPDAGQGVSPANHDDARQHGEERVAGLMADVVRLAPRDDLRYGYRVWSEQRTGLAIKLQTLDADGRVLEQAAFSGLAFEAPMSVATLLGQIRRVRHSWRVERVTHIPTTALAEGWQIGDPAGQPAPGFVLQHCYRQSVAVRAADAQAPDAPASAPAAGDSSDTNPGQASYQGWFQCVFSDGLAAVSVFIEPDGAARHQGHRAGERDAAWGATHLLVRQVGDTGWVTVVGEVPPPTLKRFAAGVSRLP